MRARGDGRRWATPLIVAINLAMPVWAQSVPLASQSATGYLVSNPVTYFNKSNGFDRQITTLPFASQIGFDAGVVSAVAQAGVFVDVRGFAGFNISNSARTYQALASTTSLSLLAGQPRTPGSTFQLESSLTAGAPITQFGTGSIQASAGLTFNANAAAQLKACIGLCYTKTLVSAPLGNHTHTLLGYDSVTNTGTFNGSTTSNLLPRTFTDSSGIFSARITPVNVAGSMIGTGTYNSRQEVGGVYANLAAAAVAAAGLPPQLIAGTALGFSYETLGVHAGLGLNLDHSATVSASSMITYNFSAPVERYNIFTDSWSAPMFSTLAFEGNGVMTLRAPGTPVLSVLPVQSTTYTITSQVAIDATINAIVRVLALKGYGIDVALYQNKFELAKLFGLDVASDSVSFTVNNVLKPINAAFFQQLGPQPLPFPPFTPAGGMMGLATASASLSDPLPQAGPGFVFIEDRLNGIAKIRRVFNLWALDCNDAEQSGCQFDTDFAAITVQVRESATTPGEFEYGSDFSLADELAVLGNQQLGVQADDNTTAALMARISPGGSGSWAIPALGAPVLNNVPEPASWLMLIAGFGLVGAVSRRRRAIAPSAAAPRPQPAPPMWPG